jgi:hypothetical protein
MLLSNSRRTLTPLLDGFTTIIKIRLLIIQGLQYERECQHCGPTAPGPLLDSSEATSKFSRASLRQGRSQHIFIISVKRISMKAPITKGISPETSENDVEVVGPRLGLPPRPSIRTMMMTKREKEVDLEFEPNDSENARNFRPMKKTIITFTVYLAAFIVYVYHAVLAQIHYMYQMS